MIHRTVLLEQLQRSFDVHRIVCLLGPRQCGKTTLAREWQSRYAKVHYFDLERPADIAALQTPELTLASLRGLIIMDEIQRLPDLFPFLRYLHDQHHDQQFLILGSASRDLIHQSSESLAGRIAFIEVTPFSSQEAPDSKRLWTQGGFPRSYLMSEADSWIWRENYMRSYIEHDLALLGLGYQTHVMRKLWMMLAHYHGQLLNYTELAASLGVSQPTIAKYLAYLEGTFIGRLLKPWHANIQKRQVKRPKFYYRDSGILHYALGMRDALSVMRHPKAGASFEGFAMEEVIRYHRADAESAYFWASHNQAELDLLIVKGAEKLGFEFKLSDAPSLTPSMRMAMQDLELQSLTIIYPGEKCYKLREDIRVMPLAQYIESSADAE